jgi:hypothetical protein
MATENEVIQAARAVTAAAERLAAVRLDLGRAEGVAKDATIAARNAEANLANMRQAMNDLIAQGIEASVLPMETPKAAAATATASTSVPVPPPAPSLSTQSFKKKA